MAPARAMREAHTPGLDIASAPSLAEVLVAHAKLAETVDSVQAVIDNDAGGAALLEQGA